jgi:hypothetical protein
MNDGRKEVLNEGMKEGMKDGRKEGRKEGRMEGWMEGRKEGWKERRMEGRKEGRKEGRMEGRKEGWKDGRKEGRKERRQIKEEGTTWDERRYPGCSSCSRGAGSPRRSSAPAGTAPRPTPILSIQKIINIILITIIISVLEK